VASTQFTNAVTQDEFVDGATTLVGPSLAGALYSLGAMVPFLTDAVSYIFSLATLALIRTPFQGERASAPQNMWVDIGSAARWVWRQPFILTMTLTMGAGALVFPSATLITIILAQQAGAAAWLIGLMFAGGGVGLMLGAWLASRLTTRLTVGQSILVSRWYLALSWPFYALTPYPAALAALTFGNGFIDPIEDVAYFSHRLRLIPDDLKGRVISICRLVPGVIRPLGLALTGVLIQREGVFPTIWLESVWLLLTTALMSALPYVRRERDESAPLR
jgi:predicted MFS family arabinose efflux permease